MAKFKMNGNALYSPSNHKVATIKAYGIYDDHNGKVASVKGDNIYNKQNQRVAKLSGSDIRDAQNRKIGTMKDVQNAIDGVLGGVTAVALWLFFVR